MSKEARLISDTDQMLAEAGEQMAKVPDAELYEMYSLACEIQKNPAMWNYIPRIEQTSLMTLALTGLAALMSAGASAKAAKEESDGP